jgi:hypothetical protein
MAKVELVGRFSEIYFHDPEWLGSIGPDWSLVPGPTHRSQHCI